ncbi:MAG: hypothetical protein ACLPVY_08350 [Acidimicrobiia bacterium]
MEVRYRPFFEQWLAELAEVDEEVFGEVTAPLSALEQHGRDLEDDARDESHPIVTVRFDLHALRRTPPTQSAPCADAPPVPRNVSGYCRDAGGEVAVTLVGGDQTSLGNHWYRRTSPRRRADSTSTAVSIPN